MMPCGPELQSCDAAESARTVDILLVYERDPFNPAEHAYKIGVNTAQRTVWVFAITSWSDNWKAQKKPATSMCRVNIFR